MENFYKNMLKYISERQYLTNCILSINHYFPYITFIIYPCIITYLWFIKNPLWIDALWRPFIAFVFVTIFRKLIDRPRPYITMNITPLMSHKQGESFPSRHALSAMIIALVSFYVHPIVGIFTLIIAIMISVGRILAGVHYISDVVVAIMIAVFFYLV